MIIDMIKAAANVTKEAEFALIEFLNNTKLSACPEVSSDDTGALDIKIVFDEVLSVRAILRSIEDVDVYEYKNQTWVLNKKFTNVHGFAIRYTQLRFASLHNEYHRNIETRL